jgi:GGDEF domain-containing protein
MLMESHKNGLIIPASYTVYIDSPSGERCDCQPLSALHRAPGPDPENASEIVPVTPATQELQRYVRSRLAALFPRTTPLSLLLIHISQLNHVHITPKSLVLHKRHRYHAPTSFLEQVLLNVRRAMRNTDQVILHEGTGAAIILPDVDQEGAFNVVERVFHSINLLQPETVIPPLKRETDITIGVGSYPRPGKSLEELLFHAGCVTHNLTLRPAVNAQLRVGKATLPAEISIGQTLDDEPGRPANSRHTSGIPYMELPARLPQSLKRLVPYRMACELRCAPVGRDHNRLTVAMAYPTDMQAISRLQSATNMVIYPVACEISALDAMLAKEW